MVSFPRRQALVPGSDRYHGILESRRLGSVASTACRRRLSNVLSSDNYADEAVSYDNAAEDLAAAAAVAAASSFSSPSRPPAISSGIRGFSKSTE